MLWSLALIWRMRSIASLALSPQQLRRLAGHELVCPRAESAASMKRDRKRKDLDEELEPQLLFATAR